MSTQLDETLTHSGSEPLYRLWPRQQEAMALLGFGVPGDSRVRVNEPVEEMLYGGQAGGGKSLLARALAITMMTLWPGSEIALFRRTYPELEDSHIRPILRETAGTAFTYHEGKRELRAPNGSLCLFRYADDEKDLRHYLSAEWEGLILDEATSFPGDWIEFLRARVRSTRQGWRPVILYTSNPGGPGHLYLKDQFVTARPPGTVWRAPDESGGMRRVFHRAALKDNPALSDEYRRRLVGIRDETVRKSLLEGDWNIGGNFFFTEWRDQLHTLPPFQIPTTWRERAIGVDFGFGAPWSCHFYVRDEDLWRQERETRWFVYREMYGAGIRDEEQARLIKEAVQSDLDGYQRRGGKRVPHFTLFCDPAIWSKNPNGLSVADVYKFVLGEVGVAPQPADHDRLSGWQRVRDYLAPQADGYPAVMWFDTCTHALRTIPSLPRSRRDPEDADSSAEDHAADELRYVLMGLGAPAQAIDHPGYESQDEQTGGRAYKLDSPTGMNDLAAGASPLPRATVPELLRAASQNGRFVPQSMDRSERAMWARFAATVKRANLGQGRDPLGKLGGR